VRIFPFQTGSPSFIGCTDKLAFGGFLRVSSGRGIATAQPNSCEAPTGKFLENWCGSVAVTQAVAGNGVEAS
jgi:hypothetical protein